MNTKAIIQRAGDIQKKANEALTLEDRKEQLKYAKMIKHPEDKSYLMKLMDESTQYSNKGKLVQRVKFLHQKYGMLHFLSPWERVLFRIFVNFGGYAPSLAVPAFDSYLRSTTQKVIINEDPKYLHHHLNQRRKENIGQNVNLIGEVVLGEKEALRRYHHYLNSLENPEINYMSIKISGIYSQLHPLNFDKSKATLIERLSAIFRKAKGFPVKNLDGIIAPKFINLDMEEYKDVELTYQVFTETLDKDEFKNIYAGIVLQAYLPDAIELQKRLVVWAQKRIAQGGSPIKMRLVKGANLPMERVNSSLKHWEVPIFANKIETDANYLAMLDYALIPKHIEAVNLGVASHNLFSIAYAQNLALDNGVSSLVSFEMLEGMANNLVRAMQSYGHNIVLYTPVVSNKNFLNAISYLVRRLDENTEKDNFIAHSFDLKVDDDAWQYLLDQFNQALANKEHLSHHPKRQQNRNEANHRPQDISTDFQAEADTDFDIAVNFEWAKAIKKKWCFSSSDQCITYLAQVGNETLESKHFKTYLDHSIENKIEAFRVHTTAQDQVEEMINIADKDPTWRQMTANERHILLAEVASSFRQNRGDLIGIMCACTGKTMMEGDVEVSEAIDFAEYYPRTAQSFHHIKHLKVEGKGTVLVIPPWNFPLAIPVGGVIAALSAGNNVIIKPATASAPIAFHFVKLMHEAGIPKQTLQVVLPTERHSLDYLTKHPAIKHIIFTGSTDTALRILQNNTQVPLSAETGGKNAIIVTASADKDLAIKSAVQSAFSNAGQKCSACSLLLLQKDLYYNKAFLSKLKDACDSIFVGSPWELSTEIGPMINSQEENQALMKAIQQLEEGESWLVKPKTKDKGQRTMRPGIKIGVKKESFTFNTELFAPLLSVACFDTLEQAIEMVNSTGYGLTSGLHSLDEREHLVWQEKIEAGNLYINRGITGAIVQRQPFGGMNASAFGNGIKTGGPNYVSCFMNFIETKIQEKTINTNTLAISKPLRSAINQLTVKDEVFAVVEDYIQEYNDTFAKAKDVSKIVGEDNTLRYLPAKGLGLRIRKGDQLAHLLMIAAAVEICKAPIDVSVSPESEHKTLILNIFPNARIEHLGELCNRASSLKRLRLCSTNTDDKIYDLMASQGVFVSDKSPLQCGRIELLNYLQEQSITTVYHRYGNLGERDLTVKNRIFALQQ